LTVCGPSSIAVLHRQALLLSYFTEGYNLLECLASLVGGCLAGSLASVRFGLDGLVESLSGAVMVWRFGQVRLKEGCLPLREEKLCRGAAWAVAAAHRESASP
jgi:hypothetical protein